MLKNKIKNLKELTSIASGLKGKGKKIVFTNGCFDLLHYGHVKYLEDAKRKGDILVVAINSDASIRRLKGNKRPVMNETDRAGIIAGLESVDFVTLFKEGTPIKVIQSIKPDVLVKGGDWNKRDIVGADFVIKNRGRVQTINFVKGRSTTNLIKKIASSF